jgi:hypothetical protein
MEAEMTSTPMSTDRAIQTHGAEPRAAKTLWQRARHGWPERFPLVQFPNAPFLIAFGALLVAALTTGSADDYARATFYAALAVWAWLELTAGVNWLKQLIGASALVFVVVKLGELLAA